MAHDLRHHACRCLGPFRQRAKRTAQAMQNQFCHTYNESCHLFHYFEDGGLEEVVKSAKIESIHIYMHLPIRLLKTSLCRMAKFFYS
jgi:hypothetical protein